MTGSRAHDWIACSQSDHMLTVGSHAHSRITCSRLDRMLMTGSHARGRITCSRSDHMLMTGSHARGRITCSRLDRTLMTGSHAHDWIARSRSGCGLPGDLSSYGSDVLIATGRRLSGDCARCEWPHAPSSSCRHFPRLFLVTRNNLGKCCRSHFGVGLRAALGDTRWYGGMVV